MIGTKQADLITSIAVGLMTLASSFQSVSAQQADRDPETEVFSFDVGEFKKSPWTLDGFLQGDFGQTRLNSGAAFYRLSFLDEETEADRQQGGVELQAGLAFQAGAFTSSALGTLQRNYDGNNWTDLSVLYEASLSWQASANAHFTLGKTLLRWGKGYAWNPTNFIGRSKNPSDPELSLEGYWLARTDMVKSFSGPLRTLSFTAVALPVSEHVNSTFGRMERTEVAGKLYLLLYDTDIDLMATSGGSRNVRVGLTASRNLASNFEVHAELARIDDFQRWVLGADGSVTPDTQNVLSSLVGIRYLASTNTTWIVEYFHNGEGYSQTEAKDLYRFIEQAEDAELRDARRDISGYQVPNFMQNYLYIKASQKEPFGWLYFTPSLFTILNLDDGSYNLVPEVGYTGVQNLELRSRLSLLSGGRQTEYGNKVNDWMIEFRARYYF